jgi:hypothetical protein
MDAFKVGWETRELEFKNWLEAGFERDKQEYISHRNSGKPLSEAGTIISRLELYNEMLNKLGSDGGETRKLATTATTLAVEDVLVIPISKTPTSFPSRPPSDRWMDTPHIPPAAIPPSRAASWEEQRRNVQDNETLGILHSKHVELASYVEGIDGGLVDLEAKVRYLGVGVLFLAFLFFCSLVIAIVASLILVVK